MKGYSIIPDRIDNLGLISGVDIPVDSKGSDCLMKIIGGEVSVKLGEDSSSSFLLREGETFEFCGKVYLRFVSGTPTIYCLFYHTV